MMRYLRLFVCGVALLLVWCRPAQCQTWQGLAHGIIWQNGPGLPLLLTDGTVLIQDVSTSQFWKLTPDSSGSYVNGTLSAIASLPAGYAPLYYASAVLRDGRVVIIGGEYNNGGPDPVWTNLGAIYDPVANKWDRLAGPSGWDNIGDAQCVVLPGGRFMLANIDNGATAILDPTTLTWSAGGTGKLDRNDEENWTLLPDGSVLTIDCWAFGLAERYFPSVNAWGLVTPTPFNLIDQDNHEVGPAPLRPNGTVFAIGGVNATATYNPATNFWTPGPSFPTTDGHTNLSAADAPACVLPSGNVFCAVSPGYTNTPTYFFEYNGTTLTKMPSPSNASTSSCFQYNMLVLPTGQVLVTNQWPGMQIYTPAGSPASAWKPTISSCPTLPVYGQAYVLKGKQLNGLNQGSYYGDDSANATNYPLVRITNNTTHHVTYCRTSNHSTMGVATGSTTVSTNFQLPANIEPGASKLEVVANGIASSPYSLQVVGPTNPSSIAISPTSIPSGTTAKGQVTIPAPAPAGGITLNLANTNSHLSVPATVTIPQGATKALFTATAALADKSYAGVVSASDGVVTVSAKVTVVPAAISSIKFSPTSVVGGVQGCTATVTLNGTAGIDTLVALTSANTALATVPTGVIVPNGSSTSTFIVNTSAVGAKSTVSITGKTGTTGKSATLTVLPIQIYKLTISPNPIRVGNMATLTMQLTQPAIVPITLLVSSTNTAVATTPASVTFDPGVHAYSFNVRTFPVLSNTNISIRVRQDSLIYFVPLTVTR